MTRVAIIGGGIGGLTAARALRRRGIEVAIYEAAPELREIGAGVALGPNAMKVLRSLDLEDDVRALAGRWEWAVTRHGKTGRVISKTSREQQASLFGSAGATVHRADLLDVLADSLSSDIVTLGARFTGKICYRSVVPVDAVPGGPPPDENVQWLGPHGTIVLYPVRRDELINVVCHYDDEAYRHESWVSRCERAEVLERYSGLARVAAADLFGGRGLVQVGPVRQGPDPGVDTGSCHRPWRCRAPDAAVPGAGCVSGDRGRLCAGGGPRGRT